MLAKMKPPKDEAWRGISPHHQSSDHGEDTQDSKNKVYSLHRVHTTFAFFPDFLRGMYLLGILSGEKALDELLNLHCVSRYCE
jgi:hypothetical protein